jgi:hypothetical protein
LGAVLAGAAVLVAVPADFVTVLAAEVALAVDWADCPPGWAAVSAWVVVPADAVVVAAEVAGAADCPPGWAAVSAWVVVPAGAVVVADEVAGAGEAGEAGAGVVSAGAAAWVTAVTAVVTGLVTVPTTEPTALVAGAPAAEPAGVTGEAEPVGAETADVAVEGARGGAASVAAWACLEKSSRRNKIPAAAIANCATRTAARCASSCGIDSSYPQRTGPRTPGGGKAPVQSCTTAEDEVCCTVTTVHHGDGPDNGRGKGSTAGCPLPAARAIR